MNVAISKAAEQGHSERPKGEKPKDFVRFYFMLESDAAAFL